MHFAFNNDNSLHRPTPEALMEADTDTRIICLIRGMEHEQPVWAYLAVRPSDYRAFKECMRSGQPFALNEWGQVLRSGRGATPNLEDVVFMQNQYGFDENLVEKLSSQAKTQQKALFDYKENVRIGHIVRMLKQKNPNVA